MSEDTTDPGLISGVTLGLAIQNTPPEITLWRSLPFLRLSRQRPLPVANLQSFPSPHQEWATPRWLMASAANETAMPARPFTPAPTIISADRPAAADKESRTPAAAAEPEKPQHLAILYAITPSLRWAIYQQAQRNTPRSRLRPAISSPAAALLPFVFERLKTAAGRAVEATGLPTRPSLPDRELAAEAYATLLTKSTAAGESPRGQSAVHRPFQPAGQSQNNPHQIPLAQETEHMAKDNKQSAPSRTTVGQFSLRVQPADDFLPVDPTFTPYSTAAAQQLFYFLPALALAQAGSTLDYVSHNKAELTAANPLHGSRLAHVTSGHDALHRPGSTEGTIADSQAGTAQTSGPFATTTIHRLTRVTEQIQSIVKREVSETFERHQRTVEQNAREETVAPRQMTLDSISDEVMRQLLRKMHSFDREEQFRMGRLR